MMMNMLSIKYDVIFIENVQGPDYQNSCKVTMFSTLYLELQHESYNVPAML